MSSETPRDIYDTSAGQCDAGLNLRGEHEHDFEHFDRSICPEPCGRMHYYCTCGEADECGHDRPAPVVPDSAGLRERVAEALYGHRVATGDFPDGPTSWVDLPEPWRDEWREAADAVLAVVGQGVTAAECDHARAARDLMRTYPGTLSDATALVEAFAQADRAAVRPTGQEGS